MSLFNDKELLEILSHIDIYNTTVFPRTKKSSLRFIKLKLLEKFPDLTDEKLYSFLNDFCLHNDKSQKTLRIYLSKQDLESTKEQDQEFNSSVPDITTKPKQTEHDLKSDIYTIPVAKERLDLSDKLKCQSENIKKQVDRFNNRYGKTYQVPQRNTSTINRRYISQKVDNDLLETNLEYENSDNFSKNLENYDYYTRYKRENLSPLKRHKVNHEIRSNNLFISPISSIIKLEQEIEDYKINTPPEWLTREEVKHYNKLNLEQKKKIIESYQDIQKENTETKLPLRFKVLNSNIPLKSKLEIFEKLETSNNLLGENTKYINLVKATLQIPFDTYSPLSVFKDNSEEVNEYLSDCALLFEQEVYGHHKIKNEFITMIGSWITAGSSTQFGNVIGITGPIGVGKTTLIKDGLSKAMNRPFYFISLGGASYSSLLQGHNYTYEGSSYGEIARGLIESKCMDPIFYFDELDKVSTDSKGEEIIHSLIHLTDPAQNNEFHDRYFSGINLDVSKALFVFSYNHADKVNPILRDRIHEIKLPDFSVDEKIDISQQYILPKISKGMNINVDDLIIFDDDTLKHLVLLTDDTTGMRALKLVLVRLLRIFNLIKITDGKKILNISEKLVTKEVPYLITKEIIEEVFAFCNNKQDTSISNAFMYI
tara:strand:- start:1510 stop:3468 length:1959 start_codon:yes stop_codon:yes gene_type:complete